nr:MAG TPA: hypothetical protein [Caudoviricetes sp.]
MDIIGIIQMEIVTSIIQCSMERKLLILHTHSYGRMKALDVNLQLGKQQIYQQKLLQLQE